MNRINFYILTLFILLTVLPGCGMLPPTAQESTAKENNNLTEPTEVPRKHHIQALQEARRLLNEQNYAKTIAFIQNEIANGMSEQVFSSEYLQAANESLDQAERLMKLGQISKAAVIFKSIQDSYPKTPALQKQVMLSLAQVTEKVDFCAEQLMTAGLAAYRSGEFSAAIDIWQQVLEFMPQHQEAKDSIQTTQLQLSNLKKFSRSN